MADSRWQPAPLVSSSIALHLLAVTALIVAPEHWRWTLLAVLVNHIVLAATGLWPRSQWLGPNWTRLPSPATARNEIALTIDDGPDPVVTPQVLDLLDQYAVRATFFCIGERAAHYPDLCWEIVRRGHTVENHSQRHRHYFSLMGLVGIRRELQAAQDTLTAITGQRPQFFRAPAGLRNPFLDPALTRLDLKLASWSARGYDTRVHDAEQVKNSLLQHLRAGAILLLHDGHSARTAQGIPVIIEVLPAVIKSAAAAGLHLVTLREALL